MPKELKVLGIHGLGDHRSGEWIQDWEAAIRQALPASDELLLDFHPFEYDRYFEQIDISTEESLSAFVKLAGSGIGSFFFGRRARAERGVGDWFRNRYDWLRNQYNYASQKVRWTAGYVVAWLEDEGFRSDVRKAFYDKLSEEPPDVILAHSLGSLISYEALFHPDLNRRRSLKDKLKKCVYVSLGSQIGNPFVKGNLNHGRLELPPVKEWFHLFNPEDDVFTAPIRLQNEPDFQQIVLSPRNDGLTEHDARKYIGHPSTVQGFWTPATLEFLKEPETRAFRESVRAMSAPPSRARPPRRRALLVGINEYPDPKDRLNGCVNDVFLMSSVLQECGFDASDMRVVLNDRATAEGIVSRLDWLLHDAGPGDELCFYYSGHGARIPTYGGEGEVDRLDETLVPWDFDWSPETCVVDDLIYEFYSQLPYETQFAMIFDCCHSGGIHRDGASKVRGLAPPDDIRHRGMKWNAKERAWEERPLEAINPHFMSSEAEAGTEERDLKTKYCGENGCVVKLGRAMPLRLTPADEYEQVKKKSKSPVGPYLPIIMEACQEHEYAYEYRHGAESYGAFTYTLADLVREYERISFERLVELAGEKLRRLRYDQTPQILGPGKLISAHVPWMRNKEIE